MGICFSTFIEKEFSGSAPPPPPRVPNMKVSDSTPPFPSKKERREAKYKRRKLKLSWRIPSPFPPLDFRRACDIATLVHGFT